MRKMVSRGLSNVTSSTTHAEFTYVIHAPSNTSILQQLPKLETEFIAVINEQFHGKSTSVVDIASFLGTSSTLHHGPTYCTVLDPQHVCAVATSIVILAHQDSNNHGSSTAQETYITSPAFKQQVQFEILDRMNSYMSMRKQAESQLTYMQPMPTSTNVIVGFTNDNKHSFATFMTQHDIQWLEMCATNFIQQYIQYSGVVSSIRAASGFVSVVNQTFDIEEWRSHHLPDSTSNRYLGSSASLNSDNNGTSFTNLYVNLFVGGEYDPSLQNNSKFDLAVETLWKKKSKLLLDQLKQQTVHYNQNTSIIEESYFDHTRSIKLITREALESGSPIQLQSASLSVALMFFIVVPIICIGGTFFYFLYVMRKKRWSNVDLYGEDNQKDDLEEKENPDFGNNGNNGPDLSCDTGSSMTDSSHFHHDAAMNSIDVNAEEIRDQDELPNGEMFPLSPKQPLEESHWSFRDIISSGSRLRSRMKSLTPVSQKTMTTRLDFIMTPMSLNLNGDGVECEMMPLSPRLDTDAKLGFPKSP